MIYKNVRIYIETDYPKDKHTVRLVGQNGKAGDSWQYTWHVATDAFLGGNLVLDIPEVLLGVPEGEENDDGNI